MLTRDLTPELLTTPPARDGWWRVDWADGRRTWFRCEGDAIQLARYLHRPVVQHTDTLT